MTLLSSKINKEITEIEITIEQKEYGGIRVPNKIYSLDFPDMFFNTDQTLLYLKLRVGHKYRVKANIPENFEYPHVGRIVEIIREVV